MQLLNFNNKKLSSVLFVTGVMTFSCATQALVLDTKIGEANLGNSGDATEKAELVSILGVDPGDLVLDLKLDSGDAGFNVTADSVAGQWFIDVDPDEPGYFLLKFGIGGTGATADTFFFTNIGEMTKLVFSNEQVQYLTGGSCGANNNNACNIGRLSHYAYFNGDDGGGGGGGSVPEPGMLFLMGAGLAGLGWARRRSQ